MYSKTFLIAVFCLGNAFSSMAFADGSVIPLEGGVYHCNTSFNCGSTEVQISRHGLALSGDEFSSGHSLNVYRDSYGNIMTVLSATSFRMDDGSFFQKEE
jgi:hypothetical protein